MFILISAIGENNEIGHNGDLIFHIKEDMKFFRDTTDGHTVVMGRKTWESLPNKLPNRENIVISHHKFDGPDLIIHDLKQFIENNKDTNEEIFIIGGGAIYSEFLPYAKNLYLTEIDATDPEATTFFPEFDKFKYSRKVIKKGKEDDLAYFIVKYIKK